ncbi:MAG TPA: class I SAM-dependent methyltransferase [Acidimicrobiales bacterium]|nr:class I SAM-dependent methyltransferase [Acidimicrobiales bacterium]
MLRVLEPIVPADPPRPGADAVAERAAHPMRAVTRQVAFEPGGWTGERRAKVAALFDGLAPEWHTHLADPQRTVPLADAYERGAIPGGGTCLEVGSGDGANTAFLAERHDAVIALDLSIEMLRRATGDRVRADSGAAPLRTGAVDVVVLVNALLFPDETDRVLAPGGTVVWVNTAGDLTPIHLAAEEVEEALPGAWDGLASEAGWGSWSVWRRLSP